MSNFLNEHVPRSNYPTTDFRPMAETDFHRKLMFRVIETLIAWFAKSPDVYVTGNLLLFYEKGNKRKHVAPDCMIVKGVPNHDRQNFLLWDEGKGPNVVIEITSKTTMKEDQGIKRELYRNVLKVPEYFQFDPKSEYLFPSFQGHRLINGEYVPIEPTEGRLVSEELGLHLERDGEELRFWNPITKDWLPTSDEQLALEREKVMAAAEKTELLREQAQQEKLRADAESARADANDRELEQLRREINQLKAKGLSSDTDL
ncbi:MAG: Uma2 family endonuclease [Gemmataceae bacterium]